MKRLKDEVRELRSSVTQLTLDVATEQAAAASARLALNDAKGRMFKAEARITTLEEELAKAHQEPKGKRTAAAAAATAAPPTAQAPAAAKEAGERRSSISTWWGGAREPQVRS